jgi:hypothetical protein
VGSSGGRDGGIGGTGSHMFGPPGPESPEKGFMDVSSYLQSWAMIAYRLTRGNTGARVELVSRNVRTGALGLNRCRDAEQ